MRYRPDSPKLLPPINTMHPSAAASLERLQEKKEKLPDSVTDQAQPERTLSMASDTPSINASQPLSPVRKQCKEEKKKQKAWKVHVYVNILKVNSVDTKENTFEAEFFVRLMWCEHKDTAEAEDRFTRICEFNPLHYDNEKMDNACSANGYFEPKMTFPNHKDLIGPFNKRTSICRWRHGQSINGEDTLVPGPLKDLNNDLRVIEMRADYRGSFTESFQLHDFPFDTQFVTLSIASNLYKPSWKFPLGRHTCTFEIDESNYTRHWVSDKSDVMSFQVDKSNPNIRICEEEEKFPVLLIEVAAHRRSSYHVWNIMVPVFLITVVCTTVFGIPITTDDGVGSRLAVTLSLLLTAVAYKITATDTLPQLGYLTYIDRFIMTNFCILVIVAFENLFVGLATQHNWDDADWVEDFDEYLLFSILVVYLATMLGFVIRAKYLSTIVKTASETAAEQLREANKALQDLAAAGNKTAVAQALKRVRAATETKKKVEKEEGLRLQQETEERLRKANAKTTKEKALKDALSKTSDEQAVDELLKAFEQTEESSSCEFGEWCKFYLLFGWVSGRSLQQIYETQLIHAGGNPSP